MPKAFIGIGSNLGDRVRNCEHALSLMKGKEITVLRRSTMIETEPWGLKEQPAFINMVAEIETHHGPSKLLIVLKDIEKELGREHGTRWGPRVIDLDILFYNDLIHRAAGLEIPHPRIQERAFVLKSLAEIAPEVIHPVFKRSVRELLGECDNAS